MATWSTLSFQDPNSYCSFLLLWLHDYNMMMLVTIILVVIYFVILIFIEKFSSRNLLHGNYLEFMWTILPMFILYDMALPSLKILYFTENIHSYMYSIKSIGHQWYWSYEFLNCGYNFKFDSYMLTLDDMLVDEYRLLDVDNRLVMPKLVSFRNVVTSVDVIHSWTVPTFGVKVDAIPGRLNQLVLSPFRSGIFYGQCSEICGMNHSYMPIVVEVTSKKYFNKWISYMNKDYMNF